jgi:hypothetical protein
MLIARLTTQLHCYEPEQSDETWSRLRQLGARRRRLLTESTASALQLRDLLECVWPAALEAAAKPLESASWCAALAVVLRKAHGGDLAPARRMGLARFTAAVRRELPAWGATRICRRIITGLFGALDDVVGVISHRHGALERAEFVIDDWRAIRARRDEVETRMLGVLDALELTELLDPSLGSRWSGRPRCWPRPATPPGSPVPGRWSNTPGSAPARTPAANTAAALGSPDADVLSCAPPPGAQPGTPNTATRCWPRATRT